MVYSYLYQGLQILPFPEGFQQKSLSIIFIYLTKLSFLTKEPLLFQLSQQY